MSVGGVFLYFVLGLPFQYMKESFPSAGEAPKNIVDPVEAEMSIKEKQVAKAKKILADQGMTKDRFPDLYYAIEQALDELEQELYNERSGSVEN